ncbi:MAG: alpha/beta hydrolase fold domain-containing protein [Aeromicrobium erythreum]
MPVWTVRPRRARPLVRVLYLHGGGYVHPLTKDYWRLVRALAGTPAEVVVPAYPLAPGADVDEVLPRLVTLAGTLLDDPLPLVVMGDSAGGALTLVVAARLRGRDREPLALVCLSPWLDATLTDHLDEVQDLDPTDPMLAESGLRAAGRWWAGRRSPDDPLVSPLHEDLRGLPPIHLHVGRRDILRPAVDDLADRVRATPGATLTVRERTAMFHVWMTRAVPEGAATRRELRTLLRELPADR